MTATGAMVVALVVATLAFFGTLIGPFLAGRQRKADKREDWARQDLVAERVAAASEKVVAATAMTAAKLDEIHHLEMANHKLLNSNLTAQMQIQYDLHNALAASLRREITLIKAAGEQPQASTLQELANSRARIAELGPLIAERVAADEASAAQMPGPILPAAQTASTSAPAEAAPAPARLTTITVAADPGDVANVLAALQAQAPGPDIHVEDPPETK